MLNFCTSTLLVCAALLLPRLGRAYPAGHEITQLPGWDGELPSRHFAGYIDAGSDTQDGTTYKMHEHYMFIESENDPKNDPVLMWTNGGPGASSFFGLFVELGPFMLDDASFETAAYNSTGVPSLFRNPYGWSKVSNLLIINSPPPVGYSYCEPAGPAGHGNSCGSWNDTRTAEHNYQFMVNWFDAFPEYKEHDLYLSGESYAGIYVPTLAREIFRRSGPSSAQPLKLKGFACGDCVLGHREDIAGGPIFGIDFFYGHAQFSSKTYHRVMRECSVSQLEGTQAIDKAGGDNCSQATAQMHQEIGGYYGYNLYDTCWGENDLVQGGGKFDFLRDNINDRTYDGPPLLTRSAPGSVLTRRPSRRQPRTTSCRTQLGSSAAVNDYPCGGPHALNVWVNNSHVRKALHVAPDAYAVQRLRPTPTSRVSYEELTNPSRRCHTIRFFFSGDNGVGFTYNGTEGPLIPFYRELQAMPSNDLRKVRVLIYSGDTDPCINTFWSQNWTAGLGLPEVQPWRPWTIDGAIEMGGYVTRYANEFDFLTIRGSGHMVPEFKPSQTLAWLTAWLHKEDWKPYVPAKP